MVRDLTPEREWEAALRLSRERFQRFFANAPVGIALIDRFGRLEEANRALGELFGARPQDLIGEPLIGFINEDDRREIAVKLAAAADGPAHPGPVEVRLKGARDKTSVVFLSRLDGLEGGDGDLMLHFIDVTEQKNLEVQFAQSQKMQAVGQLAGGVAHDFNNLLTAMIGFCDLLLDAVPARRPVLRRHHAGQAERQPRRQPGAPAPGLLAPADVAAAHHRHHRCAGRAVASVAPADRREHRIEGRPRARPRPRQGRSGPARAGHHQPGGQCARRDAGRRHPDDPHRQRDADRARSGAGTRSCRPAIMC